RPAAVRLWRSPNDSRHPVAPPEAEPSRGDPDEPGNAEPADEPGGVKIAERVSGYLPEAVAPLRYLRHVGPLVARDEIGSGTWRKQELPEIPLHREEQPHEYNADRDGCQPIMPASRTEEQKVDRERRNHQKQRERRWHHVGDGDVDGRKLGLSGEELEDPD